MLQFYLNLTLKNEERIFLVIYGQYCPNPPYVNENLNFYPGFKFRLKILDDSTRKNRFRSISEIISTFCSIVKAMNQEDKTIAISDKSRDFGAMGQLLRELQEEEREQNDSSPEETPEIGITKNTTELMVEINATLKEIAETQKSILEEIKRRK